MRAYGARIENAIARGTGNRLSALALGFAAAVVLQSSTAVGVLTAPFASSSSVSAAGGLAIMLGADVGSAIVSQLLALNIHQYWPILFFAGYVIHASFNSRKGVGKQMGRVVMGLACIFLSLSVLGSASSVVRDSDLVHVMLSGMANEPAIAFVVAAFLTWLAHSSLATLLLVVVMAESGLIADGWLAFYLVMGINAGAGVPALILGLSEKATARQILIGNFLIRMFAAVFAASLMGVWADYLMGIEVSPGQRLILLHIIFNCLLAVTFIGLTAYVAQFLKFVILEPINDSGPSEISSLDPSAISMPNLALSSASRETLRMVSLVEQMLAQATEALRENDLTACRLVPELEDKVDQIYKNIKFYLIDLTKGELHEEESARVVEILSFTTNLEHAGDVIVRTLQETVYKKVSSGSRFSNAGFQELMEASRLVGETVHLASKVFMEKDIEDAKNLLRRKNEFRMHEQASIEMHMERLVDNDGDAVDTTNYHIDILRDLKRVNSLFVSCAYPLLDGVDGSRDPKSVSAS